MITGNTMPLTIPKTAMGEATFLFFASRFGTMRFSVVLMPDLTTSAIARGTAAPKSRRPSGILAPWPECSRSRRRSRHTSVKQMPRELPSTTHWQALAAL